MTKVRHLILILAFVATRFLAYADTQCSDSSTDTCADCDDDEDDEDFDEYGLPVDWEEYDLNDFWEVFDCDEVFGSVRPIHNDSTWMLVRGAYLGIVGHDGSSLGDNIFGNGFVVPYKVAQTPNKGRGVHAAEFVKEGSLVWESHYTGCFEEEFDYKQFLVTIPYDVACDVIQWAYVESSSDEHGLMMCCDLDEGSLVNTGTHDYEDFEVFEKKKDMKGEPNNLRIVVGNDLSRMYAMRDINKGEELLVDYNDFAEMGGEEKIGIS